jgi:septal ring factor EnvC (AmiA/AmiB activator)
MFAGSRFRMFSLVTLLAAGSLVACNRNKAKAEGTSSAEIQRKAEAARKSLDGLKAPLGALDKKFADLRQQFDKLPPDLPGYGDTRGKFYGASISEGTMSSSLAWFAGRIDSAVKSQNGAELDAVSKEIARMHEGIGRADRVASELSVEVQPFTKKWEELKREGEELRAAGKNSCENVPTPRIAVPQGLTAAKVSR